MMAKHPATGCTKAQRLAFERIAVGDDDYIGPAIAAALVRRGLVVEWGETLPPNKSCPWPVTIKRYHVPLPVHKQWCDWCALQPDEEA